MQKSDVLVLLLFLEVLPPEEDGMVTYERDRLQKIQENNRMLLALVMFEMALRHVPGQIRKKN